MRYSQLGTSFLLIEEATIKIKEYLSRMHTIIIPEGGEVVETTVAQELALALEQDVSIQSDKREEFVSRAGVLNVAVVKKGDRFLRSLPGGDRLAAGLDAAENISRKEGIYFLIDTQECAWLLSSRACFLYLAMTYLNESLSETDVTIGSPWQREMAFAQEKSTFDLFLTQYARMARNFDREAYLREYARLGFTHVEVNALAGPFPLEPGVPGEFYSHFYTYCPALDQFVSSQLNQGAYHREYLDANLARLKENTGLAAKYGLTPGLLCFEPRSVPESLFEKYPTLRGARVDHPFRSFKPRFNLSIVHPVVREHYAEMLTNLLHEVPELEFLSIWTNDSGAGFEHTKSLYVGRNGGAYLIREWKDDDNIAREAAANVNRFLQLLRDTGRNINPAFRVMTRLESFYGELSHLWPQLEDGIDVETSSLLAVGWDTVYAHPRYHDIKVSGSALHNTLDGEEKSKAQELWDRGSRSYFYHAFGTHWNHEPLLGIPFPWLTYEKLDSARRLGIPSLAHIGGIQPPDKVPVAVNQEVFRRFQTDPELNIDAAVRDLACGYVGEKLADELVHGWRQIEQAVRSFPPLSIYSGYGVVWQRMWTRPLVPDIGKIPEKDRAYYEDFMCTSQHNPNRVDLAQDVLFELLSKDTARNAMELIDAHVWKPLAAARDVFQENREQTGKNGKIQAAQVFEDQLFRARALKCLFETLRSTAVWVYGVHAYVDSADPEEKSRMRQLLNEMIDREIRNTEELLTLWKTSPVEWMIVSDSVETPFIYAENLPELLERKIGLMQKYRDFEPYIDPDYMFQVTNNPYK